MGLINFLNKYNGAVLIITIIFLVILLILILIYFRDFLNKYNGVVQAIAIFILVVITFFYALQTLHMAKTMEKEHELHTIPYISVENVNIGPTNNIRFDIINVGEIATSFKIEKIKLNGRPISFEAPSPIIYPRSSIVNFGSFPINEEIEIENEIEIELTYWPAEVPKNKYSLKRYFKKKEDGFYLFKNDEIKKIS